MRNQLKFRVWNKRTTSWVHGPGNEVNLFGEMILLGGFMHGIGVEELNDCVALQYTGLKDKNDKEIYEGDYIKLSKEYPFYIKEGFVEYCEDHGGYIIKALVYCNSRNQNYINLNCDTIFYAEIIGNIFENKLQELLS